MIPSLNVEKMYHNGTSFTIIDNSCDSNVVPNKIILSVGFFKKDKININLDDNSFITPRQFLNGESITINSLLLGITKQDESFLEIESGIVEIQYYCFFDTTITAEVNRNLVVLNVPHYVVTAHYDYLLINDKTYYINKAQCYKNVIILSEDTQKIASFQIFGGNLGINYIVHTTQIKNKLITLVADNVLNITKKDLTCSDAEIELRNNIVNYLLLWNSINILKHRNKLFELNFVIDSLKTYLFNIVSIDSSTKYQSNDSTCNFCN